MTRINVLHHEGIHTWCMLSGSLWFWWCVRGKAAMGLKLIFTLLHRTFWAENAYEKQVCTFSQQLTNVHAEATAGIYPRPPNWRVRCLRYPLSHQDFCGVCHIQWSHRVVISVELWCMEKLIYYNVVVQLEQTCVNICFNFIFSCYFMFEYSNSILYCNKTIQVVKFQSRIWKKYTKKLSNSDQW